MLKCAIWINEYESTWYLFIYCYFMKLKDALKLDFVFISDGTISVNSIYLFLRIKMNVLSVLDNKILWIVIATYH